MPNNLISVTTNTNPQKVKLYIQFVIDVFGSRLLPYIQPNGSRGFRAGLGIYQEIRSEFNDYSRCLGFDISFNLVPTQTSTGSFNQNCLDWRFPTNPNPFELGPTPPPNPNPTMWQELDSAGNLIPLKPSLPLVQFYIGDGESLNLDFRFKTLANPYPTFNGAQAAARIRQNISTGFSQVIPGFESAYSTRTSFFNRGIRAGYLFTDSPDSLPVTFMHELGHVLGLSDRYFEGVDETTTPDNFFTFVGSPLRRNPPLSRQNLNSILRGGAAGPDLDTDYDPQNNLMSSRSYSLSTYQRNIISAVQIENEFTAPYPKDGVVLLLSLNDDAERLASDIPPDEPDPNSAVLPKPCRKTETRYFPSAISLVPSTTLDRATFVKKDNSTGQHNAFFRTAPGPLLNVRYDGDPTVLIKLMKGLAPINGNLTMSMVYTLLNL